MAKQRALRDSAILFFERSLRRYKGNELSFAILHGAIATELVLKARLSKIHPNLILESIDKPTPSKKTVGLASLPTRLSNLGVFLEEDDRLLIRQIAEWRNDIVHHVPDYDRTDAENKLGGLYDFLVRFLDRELGKKVQDYLPTDLYGLMDGLVAAWQEVVDKARKAAAKEGRVDPDNNCPNCAIKLVVSRREGASAFCHLCNLTLSYGKCAGCRAEGFWQSPEVAAGCEFCDGCIDAAGEEYMEMQARRLRERE